jgi:hypothetical protein
MGFLVSFPTKKARVSPISLVMLSGRGEPEKAGFCLVFACHFAPFGGLFAFAFHAWLLEMLAPTGLCQNPFLLDLAAKTP